LQNQWHWSFVAADKDIIDYLKYNLRSQMFAKALPMIQQLWFERLELLRITRVVTSFWENVVHYKVDCAQNFNIGDTNTCVRQFILRAVYARKQ
jgi:glycine C-acetyltransferase